MVETIGEEYTSQCCSMHLTASQIDKEHAVPSNRKHRGLYVCNSCGITINALRRSRALFLADVNGAINILKKYLQREGLPALFPQTGLPEGVVGEVARPLVNLFVQRKTELESREQGTFLRKAA